MPYELIDHTADLGIAVTAGDIHELYETAAHAMFEQIIEAGALNGREKTTLSITGMDRADLMINWLRELLFFWNGRELLVKRTQIQQVTDTGIAASIWYDPFDPQRHEILSDIKAVTYHGLRVEQTEHEWRALIIFDV
ncbi:MAG: archease [Desulfobacterales bacterium]|nr:archease [Desulfobacterales bacterium]